MGWLTLFLELLVKRGNLRFHVGYLLRFHFEVRIGETLTDLLWLLFTRSVLCHACYCYC